MRNKESAMLDNAIIVSICYVEKRYFDKRLSKTSKIILLEKTWDCNRWHKNYWNI